MTPTTTVMVVEDEESFIDALVVGLQREGFVVKVARDGAEALELFDMVSSGAIEIVPSRTYPLSEAAQAHRDLEARKTTGSIVLIP